MLHNFENTLLGKISNVNQKNYQTKKFFAFSSHVVLKTLNLPTLLHSGQTLHKNFFILTISFTKRAKHLCVEFLYFKHINFNSQI